jgi:hypothetical protein
MSVYDCLIERPWKRLAMYVSLIDQYLQNLSKDHSDYSGVIQAKKIYDNVLVKIDQAK